jgi:hypothetical protein
MVVGFQLECLFHSVPAVGQLLEVHSCGWSTEEVVPCQTRLQDHLGSENETQAKLVRVTCEFRLYKVAILIPHVSELERAYVRVLCTHVSIVMTFLVRECYGSPKISIKFVKICQNLLKFVKIHARRILWQGAKWRILKNFILQNEECHH